MTKTPTVTSAEPRNGRALLTTTAVLFAVGLALDIWGGLNFPSGANIEEVLWGGITVDIAIGLLVAAIGALIAAWHRFVLASGSAVTVVGVVMVGIALAGWIWLSGIGIVQRLPTGARARYMYDVSGAFYFGIPWIVGTILCVYGYRRGGRRVDAVLGLIGAVVGLLLLAATVTSAVLYGLGLTD